MKKAAARSKKDIEKYRQKLFKAKEAYRKEQARLPFEKKIEIVMQLNRFAKDFKKSEKM